MLSDKHLAEGVAALECRLRTHCSFTVMVSDSLSNSSLFSFSVNSCGVVLPNSHYSIALRTM